MAGHRARGQPLREHPCSRRGRPLLCVVPAGGARGPGSGPAGGAGPHPAKARRLPEVGCLSPAQDPSLYIFQQLLPLPSPAPAARYFRSWWHIRCQAGGRGSSSVRAWGSSHGVSHLGALATEPVLRNVRGDSSCRDGAATGEGAPRCLTLRCQHSICPALRTWRASMSQELEGRPILASVSPPCLLP